ncbi:MAG: CheB methylesterase domain-containing protein [Rickettsiales bacterium]
MKRASAMVLYPHASERRQHKAPPLAIAFGASTGGPDALAEVFSAFARHKPVAPVFVVQHMRGDFLPHLAERLSRVSSIKCALAEDGEKVAPETIYLAPGDVHMRVRRVGADAFIVLSDDPKVHFCRPAVDPCFASLADMYGGRLLAILLTGMGQDGAEGSRRIREKGGAVIIQDKNSSAVWGMPGAAHAAGAYDVVLPLEKIGEAMVDACNGRVFS